MQDINKSSRENKARAHRKAVSVREEKLKRESEKNKQNQIMEEKKKSLTMFITKSKHIKNSNKND